MHSQSTISDMMKVAKLYADDPFDRIQALYWATADCHGGQSCPLYELHCRLGKTFTPGAFQMGVDSDALFAYDALLDLLKPANSWDSE